jgi:hypothetical protein
MTHHPSRTNILKITLYNLFPYLKHQNTEFVFFAAPAQPTPSKPSSVPDVGMGVPSAGQMPGAKVKPSLPPVALAGPSSPAGVCLLFMCVCVCVCILRRQTTGHVIHTDAHTHAHTYTHIRSVPPDPPLPLLG